MMKKTTADSPGPRYYFSALSPFLARKPKKVTNKSMGSIVGFYMFQISYPRQTSNVSLRGVYSPLSIDLFKLDDVSHGSSHLM